METYIPQLDTLKQYLAVLPLDAIIDVQQFAHYQLICLSESITLANDDHTYSVRACEVDITFQDWNDDGKDFTIGRKLKTFETRSEALEYQRQRIVRITERSNKSKARLQKENQQKN